MKHTHTKLIEGIKYTLDLRPDSETAYNVFADDGPTGLAVVETPGRWVLYDGKQRREIHGINRLFETIAREIHG